MTADAIDRTLTGVESIDDPPEALRTFSRAPSQPAERGWACGLTLARVLHVHGIATTDYDAEELPERTTQNGQLDNHEEDGQASLVSTDFPEEFRAIIHSEGRRWPRSSGGRLQGP